MFDRKISDAIDYHTQRLTKKVKLQLADREDVRQRLALAALEADHTYDPSQGAQKSTYIKAAVRYRAVDMMREFERAPQIFCCEDGDDLQETERYYRDIQHDIHQERSRPEAPQSRKPLQLDCGTDMQNIAVAAEALPSDVKLDLLAVLECLPPRQRAICLLLMEGFTYAEIAARLGIHKNTVQRAITAIRHVFIEHHFGQF